MKCTVILKPAVLFFVSDVGIYLSGLMDIQTVSIMLDTGATVSVMSEGMWKKCAGNLMFKDKQRLGFV